MCRRAQRLIKLNDKGVDVSWERWQEQEITIPLVPKIGDRQIRLGWRDILRKQVE